MNSHKTDIDLTIIGGGITGLVAAYLVAKTGKRVRLVEGTDKFGGLLNTFPVGGNSLEYYYHHFFTHDAEVNWLLKELGLEQDLTFRKTTMGVFRNGKIFDFNSPFDLLRFSPLSFLDKIRFAATSLFLGKFAKWQKSEGISSMHWFNKWAGRGTSQALWEPLLKIKFGPFAEKVPLSWMIGRLRQRMGSRKNSGDERLGYLNGSLQRLSDTFVDQLNGLGVEMVKNAPLTRLLCDGNKISAIETPRGRFECDQVLFTIPTLYLYPLLRESFPDYAKHLSQIEYFGAVCTVLELDRPLTDIYWLNIADPDYPYGGIIEHTNFISPEQYGGKHIIYLSRYFAHNEDIASMSDDEIRALMIPSLKKINSDFDKDWIENAHVFKTMTGATVCDLNFSQKVPNCKMPMDNAYMANMAHVYPDERSVNNSIRVAAEACRVMGFEIDEVPDNLSLAGQVGM